LIHQGTLEEIIQTIKDKVWDCTVFQSEADMLCNKYQVINLRQEGDKLLLRLISEGQPCNTAVNTAATLEDLYLYYFSEVSER